MPDTSNPAAPPAKPGPTAMGKGTFNLPRALLSTLEAHAASTGADITAVITQAVLELLAGPDIGLEVAFSPKLDLSHGATCARCGRENVPNFVVLMDEPVITVCVPSCPDAGGPADAHGEILHVGDEVICCRTADGVLTARIAQLSIDAQSEPVATLVFEGVPRTYRMRCRMMQKMRADHPAATRPRSRP